MFGQPKAGFFAYDKKFTGGVNVAAGDVDGDGKDEIMVSVASNASSYIRVFDPEFLLLRLQFLAYDRDFYYGAKIGVADFDGNHQVEIVVAPSRDKESQVEIFNFQGNQLSEFYAYARHFQGGVNVATMKTNGY